MLCHGMFRCRNCVLVVIKLGNSRPCDGVRWPAAGRWCAAAAVAYSLSRSNHWSVCDRPEWESLMKKAKLEGNGSLEDPAVEGAEAETSEPETAERSEVVATIATVAVIGVG